MAELRLTDQRSHAWFTPVHDDARPAVIAEVCVDNTDHLVEVTRADLETLREWIDEQLEK